MNETNIPVELVRIVKGDNKQLAKILEYADSRELDRDSVFAEIISGNLSLKEIDNQTLPPDIEQEIGVANALTETELEKAENEDFGIAGHDWYVRPFSLAVASMLERVGKKYPDMDDNDVMNLLAFLLIEKEPEVLRRAKDAQALYEASQLFALHLPMDKALYDDLAKSLSIMQKFSAAHGKGNSSKKKH